MNTTIEALEDNLRQAMLTSDVAVLDELIADDLVWTMPTVRSSTSSLIWTRIALEFSGSQELKLAIAKSMTTAIALW